MLSYEGRLKVWSCLRHVLVPGQTRLGRVWGGEGTGAGGHRLTGPGSLRVCPPSLHTPPGSPPAHPRSWSARGGPEVLVSQGAVPSGDEGSFDRSGQVEAERRHRRDPNQVPSLGRRVLTSGRTVLGLQQVGGIQPLPLCEPRR